MAWRLHGVVCYSSQHFHIEDFFQILLLESMIFSSRFIRNIILEDFFKISWHEQPWRNYFERLLQEFSISRSGWLPQWNPTNLQFGFWIHLKIWTGLSKQWGIVKNSWLGELLNLFNHTDSITCYWTVGWLGTEFNSWQFWIYIPCSLSLQLLGSLWGSLGTYDLTLKLC